MERQQGTYAENYIPGAGGMAQLLRMHTSLAEDLSLILASNWVTLDLL